jgi:hypothetical protein
MTKKIRKAKARTAKAMPTIFPFTLPTFFLVHSYTLVILEAALPQTLNDLLLVAASLPCPQRWG